MAAPFFTHPDSLRADLLTLGYPELSDQSVHTTGEARLATLTWLANQADPSFIPSTPEHLAAFWDRLGIHSAPPNKAGHRFPFTAPSDRARDTNAANHFMRAAIDLVFAFRARREEDPLSDSWLNDDRQSPDNDEPLSKFDSDCLEQLDVFINQRHLLFPNTARLFQSNPTRRRPLQRRQPNTNTALNSVSRLRKAEKSDKNTIPSREKVLERLRHVQQQAHDLEEQLRDSCHNRDGARTTGDNDQVTESDDISVEKLAEDAKALSQVCNRFDAISREGLAQRNEVSNLAERDEHMEATLSAMARESPTLLMTSTQTIDRAYRAKTAVEELASRKLLLEGLPKAAPVCEALRQQKRTLLHM